MISYFSSKGRNKFNTCEDSLTSTVLDLLKYLPAPIFWDIIKTSLIDKKVPKHIGEPKTIEFWPNWNPENTNNSKRVEPDVFIRFDEYDVIIEAKRYDYGGQTENQMNNEIISYHNEYGMDNKKLIFIKLGGLNSDKNEDSHENHIQICKTTWSRLLNTIVKTKEQFENSDHNHFSSYIRIFNDIIKGLNMHNFQHIEWLKDLTRTTILTETVPLNF